MLPTRKTTDGAYPRTARWRRRPRPPPRIDDSPSSSRRVVKNDGADDASGSSEGEEGGGVGSGRREGGGGGPTTGPSYPEAIQTPDVGGGATRNRRRTGALRGASPGGGGGGGGSARGGLIVLVVTCAVLRVCIDLLVSRVLGLRYIVADDDEGGDGDGGRREGDGVDIGWRVGRRLPTFLFGRMGAGSGGGGRRIPTTSQAHRGSGISALRRSSQRGTRGQRRASDERRHAQTFSPRSRLRR